MQKSSKVGQSSTQINTIASAGVESKLLSSD